MSILTCLHCGATTSNGLALCELCQRKASTDLEFLPIYFRNLARWRPGRAGSRPVPGSTIPKGVLPARGDRVSEALDAAGNDMATWAKCLVDDRGLEMPVCDDEAATFLASCDMLGSNLTSVATLEWAGEFVREMDKHERVLRSLTETVAPGWYAGECKRRVGMATDVDDGLCGAPTYVVPGLTWVTCRLCGTTTFARDHVETILAEARGWVARPMRMAEAIVALVDTELSVPRLHKRISKWGEREQIASVRASEYAPKRFRLGEVLDLLLIEGETRAEDDVVANVS